MKLLIIGSGGHAGVCIDAARLCGIEVAGLLDDFLAVGETRYGIPIVGKTDDKIVQSHFVFIAVGDNAGRFEVFKKINPLCPRIISIVHPRACVSQNATISAGCFIASGAVVGNDSTVGMFSIINTNASLDHDSSLGEFSHLAPNSATGGHVKIGRQCFVGLNASVRNNVSIGDGCVIGMSSAVTKDVPPNTVGWGNAFKSKYCE